MKSGKIAKTKYSTKISMLKLTSTENNTIFLKQLYETRIDMTCKNCSNLIGWKCEQSFKETLKVLLYNKTLRKSSKTFGPCGKDK